MRTFVKTLTWKLFATGMAFGTTYYYTEDTEIASKMAGTTFIFGLIGYYLHERIWNMVHWGKESLD